jgi:hypothetical protein
VTQCSTWQKYAADFNAMTDQEIEHECNVSRDQVEEAEDWLDAVASWEAAGRPRT